MVTNIDLQLMKLFIISLLFLPILVLVVGCFPLVEVKVVNTSIMDKGDGTSDNYAKENDLSDEQILNLEAELIK